MASTQSTFASFKPLPLVPPVERGKPVASATALRAIPNSPTAPLISTMCALARESEDAHITGGTRSLDRRLLALNLSPAGSAEAAPVQN